MIDKNIKIIELLQQYPGLAEVLKSLGMGCSQCMGASNETLEQGIKAHGLDLKEVLDIINKSIKN